MKKPDPTPTKKGFKLPFARKGQLCIGLDIGSHAIKICVLSDNGKGYDLIGLGSSTLPLGAVEDGALQDPEAVGRAISTLINNLKVKGKKAAISISGYSVIVKKINLAIMSEEEMEAHIQAEAEQYIPFDIADVYLDFQILKTLSEEENRAEVMLVAAKKDVVDAFLELVKTTGLKTVIVDVDAFALETAYENNFSTEESVALVDIGASKTSINIIAQGTSILARDVVLGSRQLTEQIQNHFNITHDEAEALKIGLTPPGEKQEELEEIFVSTCTQWSTEIKRALDFYHTNYPSGEISKLILSGGGSKIKNLVDFLHQETGLQTELFNPFAKTTIDPKKIDPEYLKAIAPEMVISAGLASRPSDL